VPVIDLGEQFLQGSFIKPGETSPPTRRISCRLVRCDPTLKEDACGLLQMEKSVPPTILYSSYWYRSGTNCTMQNHLREITESAMGMVPRQPATVLDIGCNDGTLLRYYPASFHRVGIDPSDIARESARDLTIVQSLYPSPLVDTALGGTLCDIITAIAMFYDLEDPVEFCRHIKRQLAPDGLWIFEMSYMPAMLEMNSYDTICHEHLEYYSFAVIENILRRVGLKAVRAERNPINGGSLRCYVAHQESIAFQDTRWSAEMRDIRLYEFDLELDTDKPYRHFQDRINVHREKLVSLLSSLKKQGKRIHIYGASTKGNTILQWCGIDGRIIEAAADRNPEKHGARTIGTDIPIISEEESRAQQPDYYLVLPWHFAEEFLQRENETLRRGAGMIFPLPEIRIFRWADGNVVETHP
jgi:SAM-dependent methyltransferase